MIFEHLSKNKKALFSISLLFLAIGLFLLLFSPVIFQEGNPCPYIKGIAALTLGNEGPVKLSKPENTYLTKSAGGFDAIDAFLKNKGYGLTEQMGSGYLYNSPDGALVVTRREYSRFYTIWTITENTNNPQTDNGPWTATTTSDGVSFEYPAKLPVKYISETTWPPEVKVKNVPFACDPSGKEIEPGGQTELRSKEGRPYCVTKTSEGAAGSIFTEYVYAFPKNDKTAIIAFGLRFVQCRNYDEPKASECEKERADLDVDGMADRIARGISVPPGGMTLSEKLKECLPKSDMKSYEKCNALLKQITDYDSCTAAGFSIMKSNPPQCATPDGRTFVQTR